MSQQKLDGVNVVGEHFFQRACALLLYDSQGLPFQAALQEDPEIAQCAVGGPVGEGQALHVEQGVEHSAQGDGRRPQKGLPGIRHLPGEGRGDEPADEEIGEYAHDHAQQHDCYGRIGGPAVFPGIFQNLFKHVLNLLFLVRIN